MDTLPVGTIISYVGSDLNALPGHWLPCDGRSLAPSDYPALSKVIGGAFGTDAGGNFYLPDLRGMFLRGVDGGAKRDPDASSRTAQVDPSTGKPGNGHEGDSVGSVQADAFASHNHGGAVCWGGSGVGYSGGGNEINGTMGLAGGAETRPKNVYVYYLIFVG